MRDLDWATFKIAVQAGSLAFNYLDLDTVYHIYLVTMTVPFTCTIMKDGGPDQLDFETNYQSGATDTSTQYRNLTGNATTTVKSGAGMFRALMVNNNMTGGTVTLYDNTAASGIKIGTWQLGTPSGGLLSQSGFPGPAVLPAYDIHFNTGLTVVTAGSTSNNITILYR